METLDHMEELMDEGFAFVQVGRATVRHPDFVERLRSGAVAGTDCDHCNRCVASMSVEGIRCYCMDEPATAGATV